MDMINNLDEYKSVWNTHDVNKLIAFFTDDGIYDDVAQGTIYRCKKEVTDYLSSMFVDMPDLKVEFRSIFRDGDWMGIEVIMSGTFAHSSTRGYGHPVTGWSDHPEILLHEHGGIPAASRVNAGKAEIK